MNTPFLLMAQYNAAVIIPLDKVRADFFPHLTMPKLLRKVMADEIDLPVTCIEGSQKAAKGHTHLRSSSIWISGELQR